MRRSASRIIKAMSRPAEAKPWRDYRPIFIQPKRIDDGRAFLATHRAALQRAEDQSGVSKDIIVAILGIETSYGGNKGSFPVVDALYTLAFAYPRTGDPAKAARENQREAFFRDELAQLFALAREQELDIASLKGSYAGAMGWGQFMPSSYRDYGVDGDGDGRIDLFNDLDDVFASVANYFVEEGQVAGEGPGDGTRHPRCRRRRFRQSRQCGDAGPDPGRAGGEGLSPRGSGRDLHTDGGPPVTLVTLEGVDGPEYWIVYNNFKAITTYNISRLYATAVYQLSQSIAGRDAGIRRECVARSCWRLPFALAACATTGTASKKPGRWPQVVVQPRRR